MTGIRSRVIRLSAGFCSCVSSRSDCCHACASRIAERVSGSQLSISRAGIVRNSLFGSGSTGGSGKKNTATGRLKARAKLSSWRKVGASEPSSQRARASGLRLRTSAAASRLKPVRSRAHRRRAGLTEVARSAMVSGRCGASRARCRRSSFKDDRPTEEGCRVSDRNIIAPRRDGSPVGLVSSPFATEGSEFTTALLGHQLLARIAVRSSERYWMASLTCAVVMSPPPSRSAMVRAIFSTRW